MMIPTTSFSAPQRPRTFEEEAYRYEKVVHDRRPVRHVIVTGALIIRWIPKKSVFFFKAFFWGGKQRLSPMIQQSPNKLQ